MVNRGGIKNTSQIKALNAAAASTGRISKDMASNETVSRRIRATTLYPVAADILKQIEETSITATME
jgi:hypothetical protein